MIFGQSSDALIDVKTDFQISSKKFITDENGNIKIFINVWGHVNNPGFHVVNDGIDFATLISVVGGPRVGADLNKVRLYRETPDKDGTIVYDINLKSFLNNGDRGEFVKIKPNDTIIIKQTTTHYIFSKIGVLNTLLNILNIYLQIERR
tara:strand:- start:544 stop:990 length:447 start_codon:yes stop_codon:yes gene_type:complete